MAGRYQDCVWFLEGVSKVSGLCMVSGRYREGLRTVSGRGLEGVQKLPGRCP